MKWQHAALHITRPNQQSTLQSLMLPQPCWAYWLDDLHCLGRLGRLMVKWMYNCCITHPSVDLGRNNVTNKKINTQKEMCNNTYLGVFMWWDVLFICIYSFKYKDWRLWGSKSWLQDRIFSDYEASVNCWAFLNTNNLKYDAGFVLWTLTSLPVPQWGLDSFLRNSTADRKWITTLVTCFIICCTKPNATRVRNPAAVTQRTKGRVSSVALIALNCTQLFLCFSSAHTLISTRTWTPMLHKNILTGRCESRGRGRWRNITRALSNYMFHSQVFSEMTKRVTSSSALPPSLSDTRHTALTAPFTLKALSCAGPRRPNSTTRESNHPACTAQACCESHGSVSGRQTYLPWHCGPEL